MYIINVRVGSRSLADQAGMKLAGSEDWGDPIQSRKHHDEGWVAFESESACESLLARRLSSLFGFRVLPSDIVVWCPSGAEE